MSSVFRDLYYHLPRSLRDAVLVKRRSPLWLRAGIVFVHIPKAAGTSVNEALYGRFMGHIPAASIQRWGSAAVNSLPSFAITRNPWDRLVSAYRFAKRGSGVGGGGAVWHPEQYRVPEFENFELFVTEWLTRRDIAALDYAFQPQALFVTNSNGELLPDYVGKLEDLASTIKFIERQVGTTPLLPKANRSGEKVDFRSFYNPRLVEIVGRVYAEDVNKFGYRFDE